MGTNVLKKSVEAEISNLNDQDWIIDGSNNNEVELSSVILPVACWSTD